MRHIFIINPAAGKRRNHRELRARIGAAFPGGGCEILTTAGPGDAKRLCARAIASGDPVRLYACGGDGTLNEVVNAAAGVEHAAVTNVPLGTGNDFLRMFGKTGRARFTDIAALRDGPQMALDLMECRTGDSLLYGLDVICCGIDARVAADVHRFKALPLVGGTGAYVLSLLNAVTHGITRPMSVDMGPIHHNGPTALLCICNGRHYGGGFNPVPDAWPDDGILDMLLIGDVGFRFFATQVGKYAKGRYREIPQGYVTDYHGQEVSIASPEELAVVIDGEVMRGNAFTVKLSEKKVNFFRPLCVDFAPPGT